MRRAEAVAEKPEPQEVLKPIAYWGDLSGAKKTTHCQKFYSREEVIKHLEQRLVELDDVGMRTGQPFKLAAAAATRDILEKMIRAAKKQQDWKQDEEKPLDLAGEVSRYVHGDKKKGIEGHVRPTKDRVMKAPAERKEQVKVDDGYSFLDVPHEVPARKTPDQVLNDTEE